VLETTIYRIRYTCFLCTEVHGNKKNLLPVVRTSIWLILYFGKLCNQNCIVRTFETLIV